nr:GDSL esterase/lipase At4g16230-like [Tanacetum cinerariifolium]
MTNSDMPPVAPALTLVEKLYAVHNITNFVPIKLDLDELNYSSWRYFFTIHCNNFNVLKHIEPKTDDAYKIFELFEWKRIHPLYDFHSVVYWYSAKTKPKVQEEFNMLDWCFECQPAKLPLGGNSCGKTLMTLIGMVPYEKDVFKVVLRTLTVMLMLGTCLAETLSSNFVFGDSLVDVGNNNYIASLSKANYVPNGMDFGMPTGRYTNGRTIVDILGQELGLKDYTPPYLAPTTTGPLVLHGVNYASGGGGILNKTGEIFLPHESITLCANAGFNGRFWGYVGLVHKVIDMYCKLESMVDAHRVFNHMGERCIGSWHLIINGYLGIRLGDNGLEMFEQMRTNGLQPNDETFIDVWCRVLVLMQL